MDNEGMIRRPVHQFLKELLKLKNIEGSRIGEGIRS